MNNNKLIIHHSKSRVNYVVTDSVLPTFVVT